MDGIKNTTLDDDMFAAMRSAIAEYCSLGKVRPKFPIHPDDYHELKKQMAPLMPFKTGEPSPSAWFGGVELVEDKNAPRLPRKQRLA